MRFESVNIARVEHVDAPVRVTSRELEERMGTALRRLKVPFGMLESLTGIVARRVWENGQQPSDAATLAANKVLAKSGVDPKRIGARSNFTTW